MESIVKYFLIFSVIFIYSCSENSTEPTDPDNWTKIYKTDKIGLFTANWNDTTRAVNYIVQFDTTVLFGGSILINENNKYTKTYYGNAIYSFAKGHKLEIEYKANDYVGEIHFLMADFVYGWIDSNSIGPTDTVAWAEAVTKIK